VQPLIKLATVTDIELVVETNIVLETLLEIDFVGLDKMQITIVALVGVLVIPGIVI
jgi:hypothetical protein